MKAFKKRLNNIDPPKATLSPEVNLSRLTRDERDQFNELLAKANKGDARTEDDLLHDPESTLKAIATLTKEEAESLFGHIGEYLDLIKDLYAKRPHPYGKDDVSDDDFLTMTKEQLQRAIADSEVAMISDSPVLHAYVISKEALQKLPEHIKKRYLDHIKKKIADLGL